MSENRGDRSNLVCRDVYGGDTDLLPDPTDGAVDLLPEIDSP